jgi:hypothetical protein
MKYRVGVSVTITPDPPSSGFVDGGNLSHWVNWEIEAENISAVAHTVDGLYGAVKQVVEANSANRD